LWTDGYLASTVGKHGNEQMIANYVKEQNHINSYTKTISSTSFDTPLLAAG
jgi:putative transposase